MGNEVSCEVIVWGSALILISTFWAVVVVISMHWLLVKSLRLHHHSAAAKSSKCAFTQQANSKVLEKSKRAVWSWHVSHNSGNIPWLEIIMKCKNLSAGNWTNKVHPCCSALFWIFGCLCIIVYTTIIKMYEIKKKNRLKTYSHILDFFLSQRTHRQREEQDICYWLVSFLFTII